MNKIVDIAVKDLIRGFRSLFAVGMMFGAPLVITGLFSLAFGGMVGGSADMPEVRVGIVNLDEPGAGSPIRLGDMIEGMLSDHSVEEWLILSSYNDETAARQAVDRQEIGVAVIVPAGFSETYFDGSHPKQVILVQDPTLSTGPLVVKNMIAALLEGISGGGVTYQVISERQETEGSAVDPAWAASQYTEWYTQFQRDLLHNTEAAAIKIASNGGSAADQNPLANMMGTLMTGQMVFFAFFTGAYSMVSILNEQEEGTLARLFTTPTNRTAILAGKFLAGFLTVFIQAAVLLAIGRLAFNVKWGEAGSVLLAVMGQVAAASGFGVLLISLVKNSKQAGPVLGGGLTVLGMVGGLFTATIPGLPEAFTTISKFTPQGWVMNSWTLALGGAEAEKLLVSFGITVLIGIVTFAAGAVLFRRRFA